MLDQGLTVRAARLEYLGTIGAKPAELGPVGQLLDTVDVLLACTLQSLFNFIKR